MAVLCRPHNASPGKTDAQQHGLNKRIGGPIPPEQTNLRPYSHANARDPDVLSTSRQWANFLSLGEMVPNDHRHSQKCTWCIQALTNNVISCNASGSHDLKTREPAYGRCWVSMNQSHFATPSGCNFGPFSVTSHPSHLESLARPHFL